MRRGVVVDIESTTLAIQRAIEEAELMSGCEIHSVFTGIAGSHIQSFNSHGIVAIRDNEVSQSDIDRVIDAARAVAKYDMWTADELVRAREIAAEMIREYKVIPKF